MSKKGQTSLALSGHVSLQFSGADTTSLGKRAKMLGTASHGWSIHRAHMKAAYKPVQRTARHPWQPWMDTRDSSG